MYSFCHQLSITKMILLQVTTENAFIWFIDDHVTTHLLRSTHWQPKIQSASPQWPFSSRLFQFDCCKLVHTQPKRHGTLPHSLRLTDCGTTGRGRLTATSVSSYSYCASDTSWRSTTRHPEVKSYVTAIRMCNIYTYRSTAYRTAMNQR